MRQKTDFWRTEKSMPRVRVIFYAVIQTVYINGNDTLVKQLNLNVSPELSSEKKVTCSAEISEDNKHL